MDDNEYRYKVERLREIVPWVGRVAVIIALAVPIGIATWLLQAFAGKDTQLNVSVVASLSVVANLVVGAAYRQKSRACRDQEADLIRLRAQLEAVEKHTGILRMPEDEGGDGA